MLRRPLALALALVLLPAAAQADDLLQTYHNARNSDPQFAAAESNRAIAAERPVQARAALLPQVGGSVNYNLANRGDTDGDGQSDGTTRSANWGLSAQQSIFDWGNYTALRAAKATDRAGGFDLEAAGHNLITRTSAAYFDVLVQLETLAAAEAAEAALKKQFDFADKRLEVGLAPITDVHEARAQYDGARANTIVQRNALQDAYQALAEITGTPVRNLRALPEDFQPEAPEGDGLGRWLATAMENNPSLRAAEYALSASEHSVNTARAGHLPRLTLGAGYDNGAAWGDLGPGGVGGTSTGEGSSVGLTLTVPIFAGGATQSQVRQALSRRDISQQQLEQSRRALDRNTRNAYQTVVAGVAEIEARRQALVSARSAYEASQVGLEVGTRTVVDVLINQQNLFNAEQQYALARYNFLQNRLLLSQAVGGLDVAELQDINRLLTQDAGNPATTTN